MYYLCILVSCISITILSFCRHMYMTCQMLFYANFDGLCIISNAMYSSITVLQCCDADSESVSFTDRRLREWFGLCQLKCSGVSNATDCCIYAFCYVIEKLCNLSTWSSAWYMTFIAHDLLTSSACFPLCEALTMAFT